MPIQTMAQDDIYFVPSKKSKQTKREYTVPAETYYSGSKRNVDEYNRQSFHFERLDSTDNDIITFDAVEGVYPDSTANQAEDYAYTRRMSRFEDYEWKEAYDEGYRDGRSDSWLWRSSFYYDPWYYDNWYYNTFYYDPWYYNGWSYSSWHPSWRIGWNYPSYWHRPNYWHSTWYGGITYRPYRGVTGTRDKGVFRNDRRGTFTTNTATATSNNRSENSSFRSSRGSFSNGNTTTNRTTTTTTTNTTRNNTYNTQRNTSSNTVTSSSYSGSSRSGGGFSGGSSSGSSSRGGGGSFGGRR